MVQAPGISGHELHDILRLRYHLQPECAGSDYVLLIITGSDTDEGIDRLIRALREIDREEPGAMPGEATDMSVETGAAARYLIRVVRDTDAGETGMGAWDMPGEEIPLAEAAGRIAAEPVTVYPPGIPELIPGRRVTDESILRLTRALADGLTVHGAIDVSPIIL